MLDPYSMDEAELEKLERDLMLVTKGLKFHNNEDRYYSFLQSEEMDSVDDIVFDSIKVFNKDYDLEPIRNEEGRIDMCKASEGIKNSARAEAVMALMKNHSITAEAAMNDLDIPTKDRADILARIKKHA